MDMCQKALEWGEAQSKLMSRNEIAKSLSLDAFFSLYHSYFKGDRLRTVDQKKNALDTFSKCLKIVKGRLCHVHDLSNANPESLDLHGSILSGVLNSMSLQSEEDERTEQLQVAMMREIAGSDYTTECKWPQKAVQEAVRDFMTAAQPKSSTASAAEACRDHVIRKLFSKVSSIADQLRASEALLLYCLANDDIDIDVNQVYREDDQKMYGYRTEDIKRFAPTQNEQRRDLHELCNERAKELIKEVGPGGMGFTPGPTHTHTHTLSLSLSLSLSHTHPHTFSLSHTHPCTLTQTHRSQVERGGYGEDKPCDQGRNPRGP